MALFGRDGAFTLVQHLHVAAQRERTDHEFGFLPRLLTLGLPAIEGLSEADRKAKHLHAARDSHAVVTVFVDGDQKTERDDEGDKCEHAYIRAMTCAEQARERASSSSRSSSDSGLDAVTASKVATF